MLIKNAISRYILNTFTAYRDAHRPSPLKTTRLVPSVLSCPLSPAPAPVPAPEDSALEDWGVRAGARESPGQPLGRPPSQGPPRRSPMKPPRCGPGPARLPACGILACGIHEWYRRDGQLEARGGIEGIGWRKGLGGLGGCGGSRTRAHSGWHTFKLSSTIRCLAVLRMKCPSSGPTTVR